MHRASLLISLLSLLVAGCGQRGESGPAADSGPPPPPIVATSIEFHGGPVYDYSAISLTITSLSGSFDIISHREGGAFEHTVTGKVGQFERMVRYTNAAVEQWNNGEPVELDQEGQRRARDFVNARVFFPLLPYTLKGGDIRFEDRGLETWDGRQLHKVKVTFTAGSSTDAGESYLFWFDPETGRLEQFGYDFSGGLRFRKAIRFQQVGGITFSDQENYAIDGERIPVDTLTPDYIDQNMKLLSTVELENIRVEPL